MEQYSSQSHRTEVREAMLLLFGSELQMCRPHHRNSFLLLILSHSLVLDGQRCGETIQAIFDNADNPDLVSIGLVEQNTPEDVFCLEAYCKSHGMLYFVYLLG